MNAKTCLAAAALALIGTTASFANEVTDFPVPTQSTLTRAEVRAELLRSQASSDLRLLGETYGNVESTALAGRAPYDRATQLSRVEVKREAARARANDTLMIGEGYGTVVPGTSLRSRGEVRAEAIAAGRGASH